MNNLTDDMKVHVYISTILDFSTLSKKVPQFISLGSVRFL